MIIKTETVIRLPVPKVCGCGKSHYEVPIGSLLSINGDSIDGLNWNCVCNSSLLVRVPVIDLVKNFVENK